MNYRQARNTLLHARRWLVRSSVKSPFWTAAGVYLAICEIDRTIKTFYSNSPHRTNRCNRCAEIVAVADQLHKEDAA